MTPKERDPRKGVIRGNLWPAAPVLDGERTVQTKPVAKGLEALDKDQQAGDKK